MRLKAETQHQRFHRHIWPCLADVLRAARVLCRNVSEAEDLAQETMLRAYRAIDGFVEGSNPRAWLMTILRNLRIDRARATAGRPNAMCLDDAAEPVARDEAAELGEWGDAASAMAAFSDQQVIDALDELPEEIRMTLLLVDVQGMDHREAAGVLEVPVGTIKSRSHRGRAMLREKLLPVARELGLVKKVSHGNP